MTTTISSTTPWQIHVSSYQIADIPLPQRAAIGKILQEWVDACPEDEDGVSLCQDVGEFLSCHNYRILAVTDAEKIVQAVARVGFNGPGKSEVRVEELVVAPDHRKKGIGTLMMYGLFQYGLSCKASSLGLIAIAEVSGFFKALGLEEGRNRFFSHNLSKGMPAPIADRVKRQFPDLPS